MVFLSLGIAASMSFCSVGEMFPSGWIFSTPLGYKRIIIKHASVPSADHEKLARGGGNSENATHPELNIAAEEFDALLLEQQALDEQWLNDALLAVQHTQERVGELGGGPGHRECRGPGAILGLDDLVAAILDAVHKHVELRVGLHTHSLTWQPPPVQAPSPSAPDDSGCTTYKI